ncbi:MAG: nitrate reductase associated protein [Candidatus Binatia bacterium]
MFYRYNFESEIYPSLSLIPLHVRMKLDITGIKTSLKTWLVFSMEERWVLCHLPVETEEERENFSSYIAFLTRRYVGEEPSRVQAVTDPPWEDSGQVPDSVRAKNDGIDCPVTLEEWSQWNACQRFALCKLSVSKNEPEKFYQALLEFRP